MNTEILMNIWLALNIVFGLFTLRNYSVWFVALITNRKYLQNTLGQMLDMVILSSILAYWFTI